MVKNITVHHVYTVTDGVISKCHALATIQYLNTSINRVMRVPSLINNPVYSC